MRNLIILVITFTVLIAVGSVYLHLDTKQFIENIPKPISKDIGSVENSHQHNRGDHALESDLQSPKNLEPAWADDAAHEGHNHGHTHTDDPWKEFFTQDTEIQAGPGIQEGKLKEDLSSTELQKLDLTDPYQLNEWMRTEYLKRYGDIPEVHILVEGWLKVSLGEGMSREEKLTFMEAMNYLNPHPATQRSIERQKLIIAGDIDTLRARYVTRQPESEQPFFDVKPFFDGNSPEEGFRRLRATDPKRSAEFEKFITEEARKDPSMNLEEVEQDIQRSYEPYPGHN